MSVKTLIKLEAYKKKNRLTDVEVSRRLCVYYNYLYRWRVSGRIIGAYKRIVEDFLQKEQEDGRF